ncbi:response regulator [Thauera sp. Sel9]|uniref:response regulator n=1 Tax=Thauera sp. Sel9 TaxID=2974299 RepID=UPI0021E1629F|nr:response regulator [Thauera sp. Sel9]MCV2219214.1 response regulator [Thauera sp. Sel9]
MPTDAPRILLIDDDPEIRASLTTYLSRYGMEVSTAADAGSGRSLLARERFDLALAEVMLPDEDGLSLCRYLYEHLKLPVILLSVLADPADCVAALELGADDYIIKPFDPRELVARIKTVLRRMRNTMRSAEAAAPAVMGEARYLSFEAWTLDIGQRALSHRNGRIVELSAVEFRLLLALAEHPNTVLSRERLLDLTHRDEHGAFDRSIDTQVSRLRKKIEEDPRRPRLLRTAWGDGYLLSAEVTRQGA